ncbi:FAD/NAD(P)-binding protein, partial [Georgenia subflava]
GAAPGGLPPAGAAPGGLPPAGTVLTAAGLPTIEPPEAVGTRLTAPVPLDPVEADLVIVGGGPRAVSVVERLTARSTTGEPVRVVVVDAVEVGAGATWRTDQSPQLLNNTYSAHTTIYPDDSTPMTGPVTPGPDLVAWAREVLAGTPPVTAGPDVGWHAGPRPGWVAEEVAAIEPWSFPTRRLQGVYFREQLEAVLARGGVELTGVVATVVGLEPADAGQGAAAPPLRTVRLADGRTFRARAVVLAQGMIQARRTPATAERVAAARRHGLVYLEPGMPAERDWDLVPGGEDVIVAGLGANFFDVVAVLTAGRGGRFVARDHHLDLAYEPSGREPHLLVGSRRGLPYRSKSFYGGFPPRYTPRLATREWFGAAATVPDQDFTRDVWPQLARELVVAHLTTLARHHRATVPSVSPDDGELPAELLARIAQAVVPGLNDLVRELVVEPDRRLDVLRLDRPDVEEPTGAQWRAWTRRWSAAELESISSPLTSPRAEVSRAMAALRGQVAGLVRAGAVDAASVARDVRGWFDALGLALASGPPPERTAQLLALVRAGVVELVGEGLTVSVEGDAFVARSAVRGSVHRARALVETRMSKGHTDVTDDPLLRSLLDSGRARLHAVPGPDGRPVTTRSLDVTPEEFWLVDAAGRPDPQVIVIGIPAGDVQPGSAIGATPGLPSPLLAGADRAAAQVLALVREPATVG